MVVSLVLALFPVSGWSEAGAGEKTKQLNALQQRITSVQKSLEDIENKKNSVRADLRDNERLYGEISNTLKRLNDEIGAQEKRLQEVRLQRDRKKQMIVRYRALLVRQIRSAHAMGRQERLKLILNQEDPPKIGRLLAYYNYFSKERVAQIKAFRELLEALQLSEQELLTGTESLIRLQNDEEVEAKSLKASRKARKSLLAKLDKDYRNRNSELIQLKNDERQLQRLIKSVQKAARDVPFEPGTKKSFARLRGRLPWPVRGKLVERFGSRTPSGRLNGVLIRAKDGEPVRAVSDGRVVYADWLVRYGLLLIVDHGKGYMTLYAFNQSLFKSVGDTVRSGDQIATVGRSGGRSVPALYFEVRKNGKPANPMKWCKKVRKGYVG